MQGDDINAFSFDIYDVNKSGNLALEELKSTLLKVHGKAHVESKLGPGTVYR